MRQLILSGFLIILAVVPCAFAQEAPFSNGKVEVHVNLKREKMVDVLIRTTALNNNYPYPKALMWGGDEIQEPKHVISVIHVKFDNQEIRLPLSSYADLGDPDSAKIEPTKKGFEITIIGGDAAGSYQAVLVFEVISNYMLLHNRKVKSGEFPEQAWEETTYHYNTDTN